MEYLHFFFNNNNINNKTDFPTKLRYCIQTQNYVQWNDYQQYFVDTFLRFTHSNNGPSSTSRWIQWCLVNVIKVKISEWYKLENNLGEVVHLPQRLTSFWMEKKVELPFNCHRKKGIESTQEKSPYGNEQMPDVPRCEYILRFLCIQVDGSVTTTKC